MHISTKAKCVEYQMAIEVMDVTAATLSAWEECLPEFRLADSTQSLVGLINSTNVDISAML